MFYYISDRMKKQKSVIYYIIKYILTNVGTKFIFYMKRFNILLHLDQNHGCGFSQIKTLEPPVRSIKSTMFKKVDMKATNRCLQLKQNHKLKAEIVNSFRLFFQSRGKYFCKKSSFFVGKILVVFVVVDVIG